jgi:hypothetical protein
MFSILVMAAGSIGLVCVVGLAVAGLERLERRLGRTIG